MNTKHNMTRGKVVPSFLHDLFCHNGVITLKVGVGSAFLWINFLFISPKQESMSILFKNTYFFARIHQEITLWIVCLSMKCESIDRRYSPLMIPEHNPNDYLFILIWCL